MKKRQRIILIVLGIIIFIAIILGFSANTIVKSKLKNYIANDLPENIEITYKDLNVHTLSGDLSADNLYVLIKDKETGIAISKFDLDNFQIENVSLMSYLFGKKINIEEILFDGLKITHYNSKKEQEDKPSKKKERKDIPISIETINFKNASVTIYENRQDTVLFSSERINFSIHDVLYNKETSTRNIPIEYKDHSFEANGIYVKTGPYNTISINKLTNKDKFLSIIDIHFNTKYTKKELSKIIPFEKDHYKASADSIIFSNFDFGLNNDVFFLRTDVISVNNAVAYIYRDKLVKDDVTLKEAFPKSIRNLPLSLTIDTLLVSNSKIHYSQRKILGNKEGKLEIDIKKATISNLSNTYKSPEKTTILVDGTFLRNSPYHVNWSFDVNNKKDEFEFIGDIGKFTGGDLNVFITPIVNAKLKGEIDHTIFKIIGNNKTSMIYMSQKFKKIKIEVLNKKKKENKFISSIANVIIHTNSGSKKGEYNHITTDAKRDHTKAFFNFLVLNLKAAFKVSFVEKKNKKYKNNKKQKVHIDLKKHHEQHLKNKKKRLKKRAAKQHNKH